MTIKTNPFHITILFVLFLAYVQCTNTTTKRKPFELIILHNNDMHARFEQTDALSKVCKPEDAYYQKCYGGFARVLYQQVLFFP